MFAQASLSLVLALGLSVGGFGLYAKGRKDGRMLEQATDLREREIARMASDAAASAAASAIAGIRIQNRTVYSEVQREVSEKLVYRECNHSPGQLRNINAALTGAEPADGSVMPTSDAASGPKLWGNDTQAD